MGTFSLGHWLVILAVVVLLFGAKKIPELAKGFGQGIKDFKKAIKEDEEAKADIEKVEARATDLYSIITNNVQKRDYLEKPKIK